MTFTLSDGTKIELRQPRMIAVSVPMQSGPDSLFRATQVAVWRSRVGMTKGELGIGEIIARIARTPVSDEVAGGLQDPR
jgi:hypothetical protein